MRLLSAMELVPALSRDEEDSVTAGKLGDGRGDSPMADIYCLTSGGREMRDSRERL